MNSCNSSVSYFATAHFLSFAFHSMIVFEVPTHAFGAYIILFKTPSTMSSVKWPMLNLHFWSSSLDILFTSFASPFITYPYMAGNSLGILSLLGVNTGFQVYLGVTSVAVVFASTTTVYENRYFILSSQSNNYKFVRKPIQCFIYLLALSLLAPFLFFIPEQEKAVEYVMNKVPCFPKYAPDIPMYVFALNVVPVTVAVAISAYFDVTVMAIFLFLTVSIIKQHKKNKCISSNTLRLHSKFLKALVIQTTLPVFIVIFPILFLTYSITADYHNQVINNMVFVLIGLHGFLSTVVLLMIHEPFRMATFRILNRKAEVGSQRRPS